MPTSAPRVFLTDFGLAKDTATGSRYTRSGTTLGTPHYMSPELARGEFSALTPASDVWALGCVLYEMLSGGRRVFEGETTAAVIGAVMAERPAPLPGVPRHIVQLLERCLDRGLHRRMSDAGAFVQASERVLAGRGPGGTGPSGLALAAAAAAMLLAGVGGWAWHSSQTADGDPPGRTAPADGTPDAPTVEAEALLRRAWGARGEPEAAVALLRRALALDPTLHEARIQLGLVEWGRGDGAAARAAWAEIPAGAPEHRRAVLYRGLEAFARLDPPATRAVLEDLQAGDDAVAHLARATVASTQARFADARTELAGVEGWQAALVRAQVENLGADGDHAQAERCYDQVLAEGPTFAWVLNNRGTLRHKRGADAEALVDLDRALSLRTDFPEALANRGLVLAALGRVEQAEADYRRCLELRPTHRQAWENLGLLLMHERNDPVAGERVLRKGLEVLPENPVLLCLLTEALLIQKRPAEALVNAERAIAAEPTRAIAHNGRALALRDLGREVEAIEGFTRALALDPGNLSILKNRGQSYANVRRWKDALDDCETQLARTDDIQVQCLRAVALERLGRLAEAEEGYREADAAGATDPRVTLSLANFAGRRGELDQAIQWGERARTLDPKSALAASVLAQWYAAAGRYPEAVRSLADAVRLRPGDMPLRIRLAQARYSIGDVKGAITAAREALDAGASGGVASQLRADLARWEQELALSGGR